MTYTTLPVGLNWANEWPGQTPRRGAPHQRSPKREMAPAEWKRCIQDALGSDNELRFRQRISEHLSTYGMTKKEQRTRLREAVAIFRQHRRGNAVLIADTGVGGRSPHAPRKQPNFAQANEIQNVDKLIRSAEALPAAIRIANKPVGGADEAESVRQPKHPLPTAKLEHKPIDTKNVKKLAQELRTLIESKAPLGLQPRELADYVVQYGPPTVTEALREIKVTLMHGTLQLRHKTERKKIYARPRPDEAGNTKNPAMSGAGLEKLPDDTEVIGKSEASGEETSPIEQLAIGANQSKPVGTHNVTQGISDKALPVGARKVWNRRVVEKKADMKWHVVGHIAGLEDPARVPMMDPGAIDREALLHLLQQLLRIRHAQGDVAD